MRVQTSRVAEARINGQKAETQKKAKRNGAHCIFGCLLQRGLQLLELSLWQKEGHDNLRDSGASKWLLWVIVHSLWRFEGFARSA